MTSYKDKLRENDKALQGWANFYGKPAPTQYLNNVPDAKPRQARRTITCPTEHEEQKALISWWMHACKTYGLPVRALFAIPNAQLMMRSAKHPESLMQYLRGEGLRLGVPDLLLAVARRDRHGLFMEMKRVEGGVQRPEQCEYEEYLNGAGYKYVLCRGVDAAIAAIKEYLGPANAEAI